MNEEHFPMLEHDLHDDAPSEPGRGLNRRQFIGGMGATAAAASTSSLSGCIRKPVEHILPYSRRPEDLIPGKAMYFATAMNIGNSVEGLLVESQDGRPTKIEGNPNHPVNRGAASNYAQAWVADLYDADRGGKPLSNGTEVEWAAADAMLAGAAGRLGDGAGTALLIPCLPSPTFQRMVTELRAKAPKVRVYRHDLTDTPNAHAGASLVGIAGLQAAYSYENAKVILSMDSDFLSTDGDIVSNSRGFGAGRNIDETKTVHRLYVAEARHSLTGTMADHRLRIQSSQIVGVLQAIASELGKHGVSVPGAGTFAAPGTSAKWVSAVAEDLAGSKGASLVVVGERQPAYAHALANAINSVLGNVGKTVMWRASADTPHTGTLSELCTELLEGSFEQIFILGGNPVYAAPVDLDFGALLRRVPHSVHVSLRPNETTQDCTWRLPLAHGLESWGDLTTTEQVTSIVQPLIAPLHGTALTESEVVARLVGDVSSAYDLVRATWERSTQGPLEASRASAADADKSVQAAKDQLVAIRQTAETSEKQSKKKRGNKTSAAAAAIAAGVAAAEEAVAQASAAARAAHEQLSTFDAVAGAAFEQGWRRGLHDGVIAETGRPGAPPFNWKGLAQAPAAAGASKGIEIDFVLDGNLIDGRNANLGWMQEMPDPVTKLTWDNAAVMSAATAESLGATTEDIVHIRYRGRHLRIPALIAIGIADGSVILQHGYGRTVGRVSKDVGSNVGLIRTSDAPWFGDGATLVVDRVSGPDSLGRKHALAVVQDHKSLLVNGTRRPIARVGDLAEYDKQPDFVNNDELLPPERVKSLWTEPNNRDGHQWGMSIDLNACTGCNACAVACQSENNVSFVGKRDVLVGREMHWIRIDRYFDGDDDDPKALSQPVPCLQCENAPCEQVCPVGATAHSPDGLNDMAYNRCIGTRYCANNCPAKVRRFNFRNYAKQNDDLLGPLSFLQRNPDVTVRFRGVIEKCTYCVQRVNEARIEAKREGHGVIPDGAVVPACAQTCPTQAIVFGDVNDPETAVSKSKASPRNYVLFSDMNIKPRTSFKARIRNPNPKLS
jgi:Fe-S-cluster-containing dehydrogenase component/anaerobic selenocysteine-containing dehydrogenase